MLSNLAPARRLGASGIGCALLLCGWLGAPAAAKTIKLPDDKPKVMFDVPDDWVVTKWAGGLEVRSPDKSVSIITGLNKGGKTEATAWQKQATQRMMALGVTFDPTAKVVPPAPKTAGASPLTPPTLSAPSPGDASPATIFSGAPSIETPERAPSVPTATEDKEAAGLSLEQLTGKAPIDNEPRLHFHVVTLYGATLDRKPVDAQFFIFAVDKGTVLLMQQESSPTDDRVGPVITSIRRAS